MAKPPWTPISTKAMEFDARVIRTASMTQIIGDAVAQRRVRWQPCCAATDLVTQALVRALAYNRIEPGARGAIASIGTAGHQARPQLLRRRLPGSAGESSHRPHADPRTRLTPRRHACARGFRRQTPGSRPAGSGTVPRRRARQRPAAARSTTRSALSSCLWHRALLFRSPLFHLALFGDHTPGWLTTVACECRDGIGARTGNDDNFPTSPPTRLYPGGPAAAPPPGSSFP